MYQSYLLASDVSDQELSDYELASAVSTTSNSNNKVNFFPFFFI